MHWYVQLHSCDWHQPFLVPRTHLQGGIVYSNKVILLSSIHSKGLIICSLSHGLEPTLAIHK